MRDDLLEFVDGFNGFYWMFQEWWEGLHDDEAFKVFMTHFNYPPTPSLSTADPVWNKALAVQKEAIARIEQTGESWVIRWNRYDQEFEAQREYPKKYDPFLELVRDEFENFELGEAIANFEVAINRLVKAMGLPPDALDVNFDILGVTKIISKAQKR